MFGDILLNILAPILLMVFLGAVLRWKFRIDITTLTKLNIHLFVPAFVFDKVSTSSLAWSAMGGIAAVTVLQVLLLGILVFGIGRIAGAAHKTLAAVAMAVMFYNSGNFGLPLAELAFGTDGAAAQALVLMAQNILTFTVGGAIAAMAGTSGFGRAMAMLIRLPFIPTLAAALAAKWYLSAGPDHQLPKVISETARFLSGGLVPIALVTLGAQLAANPRWPRWRPVSAVLVLRLVYAPIQMALLLFALHMLLASRPALAPVLGGLNLWPWPAQLLILTAAVPTAVNTLLLTLELEGDAELAADCVFWTTVISAVTLGLWLLTLRLPMVYSLAGFTH